MTSSAPKPFSKLSFTLVCLAVATGLPMATAHAQVELTAPPALAAGGAPHYGMARQWFLSAETFATPLGSFGANTSDLSVTWSAEDGSGTPFNVNLRPVLGYFFSDLIYGRLGFDIAFNNTAGIDRTGVGVAPGVGVVLPVARKLTFAPWLGLNLLYEHVNQAAQKADYVRLNLEVHAPVVFDIVEHFSATAGIYYAQSLVNHVSMDHGNQDLTKSGSVGLTAGLLGYW